MPPVIDLNNHPPPPRNPGLEFNADWLESIRVNLSAVESRIGTLGARRTVKKDYQTAWLLKALSCMDLTTLSGDDTPGRVKRLCAKARQPVRAEVLQRLGLPVGVVTVGGVCVYPAMIPIAKEALHGSDIPVAAVAAGFPAGLSTPSIRLQEVSQAVADGADEIDIVINRGLVLTGRWHDLYDEVRSFRQACGPAHLKTILATGQLATGRNIAKASAICMMAGADFIKTSTGMEPRNANLAVALIMARMIREYERQTGFKVGFKPAGGISTAKTALSYLILIKEELGNGWLNPALLRLGASSLLNDIERQLEHRASGRYAAAFHQPMG